jgi:hypothetical protein
MLTNACGPFSRDSRKGSHDRSGCGCEKKSGNQYVVKDVRFNGPNILWIDHDSIVGAFADDPGYRKMSVKDFEKRLSDEMVVPAPLTVTYLRHTGVTPELGGTSIVNLESTLGGTCGFSLDFPLQIPRLQFAIGQVAVPRFPS